VLLALVAALVIGSPGPRLAVSDMTPFVVRGIHFRAGERVSIVTYARVRSVRIATASAAGAFTVRYRFSLDRCSAFAVSARGSRGSRASLKFVGECPPPPPLDRVP